MRMRWYRLKLPLKHPFTIARGTIEHQVSIVVQLEHDGINGYGEVTENEYYGHTASSIQDSLSIAASRLSRYEDRRPEEVWDEMYQAMNGDRFALSALDMAAHDLHAKRAGVPTWKDWGLSIDGVPQSSFTIGIDSLETMLAKLDEVPGWPIYKIKLGTERDIEIVTALREKNSAIFRVDANCGWTPEQAIENSRLLAELGVEFIEQPLPVSASREAKLEVFNHTSLPVIADEDCQTEEDVQRCVGLYHGVNVKVCKCGGLTPALKMLREARALGMKTMVGCMVESSIGISGAAQLAPLLDYADLDGAELLSADPATGVSIDHGTIRYADGPGSGGGLKVEQLSQFWDQVAHT